MTAPAPQPIRIVLIDASELLRRGIRATLAGRHSPATQVVGEAGSGAAGVALCLRTRPDVVLLAVQLPDGSGLSTCRTLATRLPRTRVIILADQSSDSLVYDAVNAGAAGYLLNNIAPVELPRAVCDVAAGKSILDPTAAACALQLIRGYRHAGHDRALASLSRQELRVLACVAEGMTNKQAGARLGLSENTVKNYLVSVFGKLKVRRRSQAAALYAEQAAKAVK